MRRTSPCTAASVPRKRAASTQSASAASAGESSSSAAGTSSAAMTSRAAEVSVSRGAAGHQGHVGAGQGAEPEMRLGDDAEPAEAADLELGEVVAGHVLHHPAAGLHQPPVAGGDRAAEHVVPHRAEPVPKRARRRGGDDGAEAPLRPPRRVDARATCPRRPAGAGAPRAASPPARSRPGRPGSPTAPGRAPRVLTVRSAGASAWSQVPWPSTRIFQPSSCASRQTSESASSFSGMARGCPPASRSTPPVPSSARSRPWTTSLIARPPSRAIRGTRGRGRPCRDWPARRDRTPAAPPASRRASRRRRSTACSRACRSRRRARR